jgi:hypothetical protein
MPSWRLPLTTTRSPRSRRLRLRCRMGLLPVLSCRLLVLLVYLVSRAKATLDLSLVPRHNSLPQTLGRRSAEMSSGNSHTRRTGGRRGIRRIGTRATLRCLGLALLRRGLLQHATVLPLLIHLATPLIYLVKALRLLRELRTLLSLRVHLGIALRALLHVSKITLASPPLHLTPTCARPPGRTGAPASRPRATACSKPSSLPTTRSKAECLLQAVGTKTGCLLGNDWDGNYSRTALAIDFQVDRSG